MIEDVLRDVDHALATLTYVVEKSNLAFARVTGRSFRTRPSLRTFRPAPWHQAYLDAKEARRNAKQAQREQDRAVLRVARELVGPPRLTMRRYYTLTREEIRARADRHRRRHQQDRALIDAFKQEVMQ